MPLHWEIGKTLAYKNKDQYENFDFIVDAIVFSTMCVNIGQIKDQELANQFVDRAIIIESNFGFLYKLNVKYLFSDRKFVRSFIGLYTNATTLTFNQWYKDKILNRRKYRDKF